MQTINIDFSKKIGKIKKINGVCNGPSTFGFQYDHTQRFKELGIPFCRLHDTEYPLGSGHFIDVPQIFKDFSKDENDENNYDFRLTDEYLKAIKNAGADIIYRLGVSIENEASPFSTVQIMEPTYINPPEDFDKWARICANIIRHYNEGWANGFHMDIKYWEIWNEPESEAMWTGTRWEFYDLYITVSKHLKKEFPNIKVGGFAGIGFYPYTQCDKPSFDDEPYLGLDDFNRDFLMRVKENNAPLDFFSWHLYSGNIEEYMVHANVAREMLDEFGFTEAESIIDEWNWTISGNVPKISAYISAVFYALQNSPIDIATYYDAQPRMDIWCGLFSGRDLKKGFYAFKAFNELYKLSNQYQTNSTSGAYVISAKNDNKAAALISNYEKNAERLSINVRNLGAKDGCVAKIYAIDDNHDLEIIREDKVTGENFNLYIDVDKNTTLFVEFEL